MPQSAAGAYAATSYPARMPASFRLVLAISIAFLAAACGSGLATNQPCERDGDCESGRCGSFYDGGERVCIETCAADADCPEGLACGTSANGDRVCAEACDPELFYNDGFVCVDHAPVACELAGDAWDCFTCGCGAGTFCDAVWSEGNEPGRCQPVRAVGQPCLDHDECASGNCSVMFGFGASQAGVCWNAAGAACTDATCGSCDATLQGDVCAQHCDRASMCDGDEACARLNASTDPNFYCRPSCTNSIGACPRGWACTLLGGDGGAACFPPTTCVVGAAGACPTCTDVSGLPFDICAETCTILGGCPLGWSCVSFGSGDARCLPPA
jgi:hypothetical protein